MSQTPPLSESLGRLHYGDVTECDELHTFVGRRPRKKQPKWSSATWLWLAAGRRTSQVFALTLGGRTLAHAKALVRAIPASRTFHPLRSDEYPVYGQLEGPGLLKPWQLCLCPKGSGETSFIEGVNNALRQRVSYLGRRTSAFARSTFWLEGKLRYFLFHWNLDAPKRLARRLRRTLKM